MKHLRIYLALLCAIVCWQSAIAEPTITVGGVKYMLFESHNATLLFEGTTKEGYWSIKCDGQYSAYKGDIVVPASIEYLGTEYVVTSIAAGAFSHSSITSITIPQSVIYIGDGCFNKCANLANVTIAKGVTSLGEYCFKGCTSLASITIPRSVTSLGDYCFQGCTGLTSITIPRSVTSLGNYCFSNCTGLTSITISDGATSLGDYCFQGCTGLTSITIPRSVTSLGNYCFSNCTGLTSITISDGVTSLGDYCFYGCTGLTSITIPESVTSLSDDCFRLCTSLASITIPESVTSIGYGCFSRCTSLTSINIPQSVTSLGNYCFYGCTSLTNITIPERVTSLSNGCFNCCTGLTRITISDGVTSLGDYCFSGCTNLGSINLPESVTSLGDYCFSSCTNLGSINLPESVTSLGDYCFSSCTNLGSINLPEKLYSIGANCFKECGNWEGSITIPTRVSSLKDNTFKNCSKLTSISLPDGVTSLSNACFKNCVRLTDFKMPDNVTSIGDSCFANCSSLPSITIPKQVTQLNTACFENCRNLTTILLPENMTSVGASCFYGCSKLATMGCKAGFPPTVGKEALPSGLAKLYVPKSAIEDYSYDALWGVIPNIYPFVETIEVPKTLYISPGTIEKITATATPEGYDPESIIFTSSNESIATVTDDGQVTAVNFGSTTVTAKAIYDPDLSATCKVTVTGGSPVSSIILSTLAANMNPEETLQLTATVLPEDADRRHAWSSSDESIATVSSTGLVTAISEGTAVITATTTDGTNLSASCVITVGEKREMVWTEVTSSTFANLKIGSAIKIFPYGLGGDDSYALCSDSTYCSFNLMSRDWLTEGKEWTLLDAGDGMFYLKNEVGLYWALPEYEIVDGESYFVRTVSDQSEAVKVSLVWNGTYSGIAFKNAYDDTYLWNRNGDNFIYYWYKGGQPLTTNTDYTYNVYVATDKVLAKLVELDREEAKLTPWESLQLTATVLPEDANNKSISWSSSDESVAYVSNDGLVTAVHSGTATITASTTGGTNPTASCVITVADFGSVEWTEVTNSNIGSLKGGSVIMIYPYGYGGTESMALSSSTTGGTYCDSVLTSTEYAGQEGGNKWILIDAGDGTFYLRNGVGLYWTSKHKNEQINSIKQIVMSTKSDWSKARKVSLVWNDTYSGVAFKKADDDFYLGNEGGYNIAYIWSNNGKPLTFNTNYTYNIYVGGRKASGIDGISINEETDAVYYQLNGIKLAGKPQQDGVYIRVKDGKSQKIVVRKK